MITLLFTTSTIAGPFGRVMSVLSGCAAAASALRQRRQTYQSLSALDDRALRDIGLNRTMLLGVSRHGIRTLRDAVPPSSQTH